MFSKIFPRSISFQNFSTEHIFRKQFNEIFDLHCTYLQPHLISRFAPQKHTFSSCPSSLPASSPPRPPFSSETKLKKNQNCILSGMMNRFECNLRKQLRQFDVIIDFLLKSRSSKDAKTPLTRSSTSPKRPPRTSTRRPKTRSTPRRIARPLLTRPRRTVRRKNWNSSD